MSTALELDVAAPLTGMRAIEAAFAQALQPETRLSVSEWADRHRILSSVSAAEPGQWRTERAPYLREIMDCLSIASPARRVVFMKGSQVGATECGNNWLAYIMDEAPAPILMVYPTLDLARKASKQRIAPMLRDSPRLADLVGSSRVRDAGNTLLMKEFRGGVFIMTGANSGAGLRSMPIRFLFCDEVDEYDPDVAGQGDPIALAEARTVTFRAKIFLASTPTVKGHSRIEDEFLATDQRRYFVPCPYCAHEDWLRWENMLWDEGHPETAHMVCVACGGVIEERHKRDLLLGGSWRATAVSKQGAVGFHLSALYSPRGWKSWAKCAAEFESAKADPPALQVWVNHTLGETWEDRGDSADPDVIMDRAEIYKAEVPHGVGVLVAAVDVQDDRLEYQIVGFGSGEEAWLIQHAQLDGAPSGTAVWTELDRVLAQRFVHESGQRMRVLRTTVDSGGHFTDEVYRYCKARRSRGVFAVRGGSTTGDPLVGEASHKNRLRIPLFTLCTDTGKAAITARLRIAKPGPGRIHLPSGISREYVEQLVSETVTWKWRPRGGSVRVWRKVRDRNEAFDLWVYSLAALHMLGPELRRSMPREVARWSLPPAIAPPPDPEPFDPLAPPPSAPARGRGRGAGSGPGPRAPRPRGWVDGY